MSKRVAFFIDDQRDIEVPDALKGQDVEWFLFRSLRDLIRSEHFVNLKPDVVCFDYYLNARGTETGVHAMFEVAEHCKANNWPLPKAAFHSSDPSCNDKMQKQWLELGGPLLQSVSPEVVSKSLVKKGGTASHFRKNKR